MFLFAALIGILTAGRWALAAAEPPLVVTEVPRNHATAVAKGALDQRYPAGSRLILVEAPYDVKQVRVLSEGLYAAGNAVVTYDGQGVFFTGKASAASDWQIYEARMGGGRAHAVTAMPGGAMNPALLPDGSVVFASPANSQATAVVPALYAQSIGSKPRRLTFSTTPALDPTVLADGRILFVSAAPNEASKASPGLALYTINNDGTEIAAFAGQHDPAAALVRPREVSQGRVVFLVTLPGANPLEASAEFVREARPFQSRGALFPGLNAKIGAVERAGESNLLVCASTSGQANSWTAYCLEAGGAAPGKPLFKEAEWDTVEAILAVPSKRPMGRISNMDIAKRSGQILCLDVNDTTYRTPGQPVPVATRVRVVAVTPTKSPCVLGEVPVQPDGSFMAEVPADMPLGFEALDEQGRVLRKTAPIAWVRPGENRSCVGCHAGHNRSPHNHRPMAVRVPVPRLFPQEDAKLAHNRF